MGSLFCFLKLNETREGKFPSPALNLIGSVDENQP
jgi:hypothetical protein